MEAGEDNPRTNYPSHDAPSSSLAYMPPRDDQALREQERHFRVAGVVLSALSVFALVFVVLISNLPHYAPPPTTGPLAGTPPVLIRGTNVVAPALCAAAIVSILGGIAWYQWRTHRSRAFLMGVLIGVGIAALVEGACFVIIGY